MDHDQIPLITQNMSFTDVYPVNDRPQEDPTRHQSPPLLLAFSSTFSPRNPFLNYLPSIPSSSNNEQNRPLPTIPLPFSLNNDQYRHFLSNNNQNRPFPTVPLPFSSHNNPNRPFIPTNASSHNTEHRPFVVPQFPSFPDLHTGPPIYNTHNPHYASPRYPPYQNPRSALPDFKDSTLPSSTFIPLLTGRADWGAWSDTVSTAIMNMNLYGHIAEHYTPRYGFDPGSKPTYPPIIDENASQSDIISWYDWWCCDGQVSHILFSRLSASARSQLSGAGATHHTRRTARELYLELVSLFGGTDYNTAAAIREELSNLMCAPNKVQDYVTCWRTGLNQLCSSGHPFDHADSIRFFVNHLPLGSTYDFVQQQTLYQLSTAKSPAQLPSFESVVDCVRLIELNRGSFQPSRSRTMNSTHSTTTSTPNTKDTSTPPNAASTSQPPRPPRSSNFCTICRQTGHVADDHNKPGGVKDGGITDRGKQPAPRAYMADLDSDGGTDGGATSLGSLPTPASPVVAEDSSPPFAALGTTVHVPPTNTIVNEDYFFDLYRTGVISTALSSADDSSVCFSSLTHLYNMILDSGCTNHIAKDHSLFWTYNTSLAVPVKTANCGILETFAKGDVKFQVQCGARSIVLTLRDCLHAPSAPINLLSVGAMQERRMRVHFDEDSTTIHFPSNHPDFAGLSFKATVLRRLSFLHCDFVVPTVPVSDGTEVAFPTFPIVEKTPSLWHRRFGHLGVDATHALLTKNYAEGVDWTGPLVFSERCVSCLIGKHPQIPYTNHAHRASAVCELLHMDTCGPFPVHTPHHKSSFWAILDDKSNYGHVELLSNRSQVYSAYVKVEALWEAKSGNRVLTVRMDGAKEFCKGKLGDHLTSHGIVMQVTAPYAHSQNGKAEHFVRTIEDGLQTLLADSGLPMSFWGDAALTINYLRNRVPTTALPANTTAYEVMHKTKPNLAHLCVWGCQCFVIIPPELRSKGGP